MKLYLIRHGRQSSKLCNVDVDLGEAGFRQAALVGERLVPAKIDAVYSSDLLRAVQTAQSANIYWNVEHFVRPGLREISFGDMEGMTDAAIAEQYRDFKREQQKMERDLAYPGGECAGDVVARALPVFEEMARSGYRRVAVVTHGGVIRSLIAHFLGMDLAKWRMLAVDLENCSISELDYHEDTGRFYVERLNDYAHLERYPELLRSGWVDEEN